MARASGSCPTAQLQHLQQSQQQLQLQQQQLQLQNSSKRKLEESSSSPAKLQARPGPLRQGAWLAWRLAHAW
jgi:hypothetical protein